MSWKEIFKQLQKQARARATDNNLQLKNEKLQSTINSQQEYISKRKAKIADLERQNSQSLPPEQMLMMMEALTEAALQKMVMEF